MDITDIPDCSQKHGSLCLPENRCKGRSTLKSTLSEPAGCVWSGLNRVCVCQSERWPGLGVGSVKWLDIFFTLSKCGDFLCSQIVHYAVIVHSLSYKTLTQNQMEGFCLKSYFICRHRRRTHSQSLALLWISDRNINALRPVTCHWWFRNTLKKERFISQMWSISWTWHLTPSLVISRWKIL